MIHPLPNHHPLNSTRSIRGYCACLDAFPSWIRHPVSLVIPKCLSCLTRYSHPANLESIQRCLTTCRLGSMRQSCRFLRRGAGFIAVCSQGPDGRVADIRLYCDGFADVRNDQLFQAGYHGSCPSGTSRQESIHPRFCCFPSPIPHTESHLLTRPFVGG